MMAGNRAALAGQAAIMKVGTERATEQAILWWAGLAECLENGLRGDAMGSYTSILLRLRITMALANIPLMDQATERMARMWLAAADRAEAAGVDFITLTDAEADYFRKVFETAELYLAVAPMQAFIVAVERTTEDGE